MAARSIGGADGIGRGARAVLETRCEVVLTAGLRHHNRQMVPAPSEACPGRAALYSWHYVNLEAARRHGWSSWPGTKWAQGWLCEHHLEGLIAMREVSHVWADGVGCAPRLVK